MQDFNTFFNQKTKKILEQHSEKHDLARLLLGFSILFLLFSLFVPQFLSDYLPDRIISFFRFLMVFSIPLILVADFTIKKASKELKKDLMPKLVKVINPAFTFQYEGVFPKEMFMSAKFLSKGKIYRYSGKELIQGKVENRSISFSEVLIKQYNKKKKEKRIAFQGVVYCFELRNSFSGTTTILPKKVKTFVRGMKRVNDIRFTQGKFQKKSIVYSDNEKAANAILHPATIKLIKQFLENQSRAVRFSFHEGKLFIAIERKRIPLDFRFDRMLEKEDFENYVNEIQSLLELVEKLQSELSYTNH